MTPCRRCHKEVATKSQYCASCSFFLSGAHLANAMLQDLQVKQAGRDAFYDAKFDGDGNVVPGWDFNAWILNRVADIPKTCTPDCMREAA